MHEDLTSYDCIVFIIPVYPHNIYYKIINIIKIKNLVSIPIHLSYYSFNWRWLKEKERKCTAFLYGYLFICIFIVCIVFLLCYISTSHTCSLSLGQREKCTVYVCTLCTLLCTVQFARLTSSQLHLQHWTFNIELIFYIIN